MIRVVGLTWPLFICFVPAVAEARRLGTPLLEWSTSNIQYLYGFNWNVGKDVVDTFTIEHANRWRYGDNYFFMDVQNIVEQEPGSRFTYYSEFHPRFSLNRIFGLKLAAGPVTDVLISSEFDFADSYFAYSAGLGVSLEIPNFSFANANVTVQDNINVDDITWHLEFDWELPFYVFDLPFVYGGYIDIIGPEGTNADAVFTDHQLLLDVGHWLEHKSQIFVGVEFRHIHNRYYVQGANEYVPQPMLKYVF
jgi:nucleoside-specific outer membrane channel protein Tsx